MGVATENWIHWLVTMTALQQQHRRQQRVAARRNATQCLARLDITSTEILYHTASALYTAN